MGQRVLGAAFAILFMTGTVALSRVDSSVRTSADAELRLSWRAVGERIEECRVPSAEELAELPAHMRQREVCDRRLAPFRLEVRIDGSRVVSRDIRPSGAQEDRPTYVFEEIPVAPGRRTVEVSFAVAAGEAAAATEPLLLSRELELAPQEIVLVTRDPETGAFLVKRGT